MKIKHILIENIGNNKKNYFIFMIKIYKLFILYKNNIKLYFLKYFFLLDIKV